MERKPLLKRLLSGILAFSMSVSSMTFVVSADGDSYIPLNFREVSNSSVSASLPGKDPISVEEEKIYADDETVRVSIVLDGKSTIEYGYEAQGIAENAAA